jgi:hypothetical protein
MMITSEPSAVGTTAAEEDEALWPSDRRRLNVRSRILFKFPSSWGLFANMTFSLEGTISSVRLFLFRTTLMNCISSSSSSSLGLFVGLGGEEGGFGLSGLDLIGLNVPGIHFEPTLGLGRKAGARTGREEGGPMDNGGAVALAFPLSLEEDEEEDAEYGEGGLEGGETLAKA